MAGTNNTSYMTPLGVAQFIGGNTGGAGIVADLVDLPDPGADRLLGWDDTANAAAFIEADVGLTLSGNVLSADFTEIDHDSLMNFVEEEHIDHTSVAVTDGQGVRTLSTTNDLTSDLSFSLDFSTLTSVLIGDIDLSLDTVAFYDASEDEHRQIPTNELFGEALGQGRFFRSGNVPLPTVALDMGNDQSVGINTVTQNDLNGFTFDPVAGTLTATRDATVFVSAKVFVFQIDEGTDMLAHLSVNSTRFDTNTQTSLEGFGGTSHQGIINTILFVNTGDVISLTVETNSSAGVLAGSSERTHLNVIELG